MAIADMLLDTYVVESMLLRVEKLSRQRGESAIADELAMLRVYLLESQERAAAASRRAILHASAGDEQRVLLMGLKRLTKPIEIDAIALRRQIAKTLIEANRYPYGVCYKMGGPPGLPASPLPRGDREALS